MRAKTNTSEDEYERVAVRGWPINAMIIRKLDAARIGAAIDEAVDRCRAIESPHRRAHALMVLTQATISVPGLWTRLREIIVETVPQTSHWQGQRAIRDITQMIAAFDGDSARVIAGLLPECKARRQALQRLEAGEDRFAWLFHWTDGRPT